MGCPCQETCSRALRLRGAHCNQNTQALVDALQNTSEKVSLHAESRSQTDDAHSITVRSIRGVEFVAAADPIDVLLVLDEIKEAEVDCPCAFMPLSDSEETC